MNIRPTFGPAASGLLTSGLGLVVYDTSDWAVLQTFTANGITEVDTGVYGWSGSITAVSSYLTVWKLGALGAVVGASVDTPFSVSPVFIPVVSNIPSASQTPGAFYIKRHDTHEPFVAQALFGGQPVDVSAATLLFKTRVAPDDTAGELINKPAIVVTNAASQLPPEYSTTPNDGSWMAYFFDATGPAGDTALVGTYDVEIEATWPDGTVMTFPTTSDPAAEYWQLHVVADLDDA